MNVKFIWVTFKKILCWTFPAKMVSSVLGIGYLPSWQNYWSSFFILFAAYVTMVLLYGSNFIIYKVASSSLVMAVIFIKLALTMLVLQLVGIFVFHIQEPSANSCDGIVIQIASGQILTVALSIPAIMSIYLTISKFYVSICKQILTCPFWFNDFMHLFFLFVIPYAFFNFIEIIKPWPISLIQLSYNNVISITLEGILHAFYAVVLLYLTAFIFCDLTVHNAIILNNDIIQYVKGY